MKVYGTTSYETQIAILSHYLHTFDGKQDLESRANRNEILTAIRDYIEYKRINDKKNPLWQDVDDEQVAMAAESPLENELFRDFYDIPFPAPNAMDFWAPQHRERFYIIGFSKDLQIDIK